MVTLSRVNAPDGPLDVPPDGCFAFECQPATDIFVFPDGKISFNAPYAYTEVTADAFLHHGVQATVRAEHQWPLLFDQAGLLVILSHGAPPPDARLGVSADTLPGWIKAGIEVFDGVPHMSVVARAPNGGLADWSLFPLHLMTHTESITVTLRRRTRALAVYASSPAHPEKEIMVRKIPWVFSPETRSVLVGVFAARPDPHHKATGPLHVHFDNVRFEAA